MSKKLVLLISFLLVLGLAGSSMAQIDPPTVTDGHVYLAGDVSNGTVLDSSAVGHTALFVGEPALVDIPAGRALQFDGVDDFIVTDFVIDPADGPFSVFAWVRGGAAGQVLLSQIDGANWLRADASEGKLMTELQGTGRFDGPLSSQAVIIDGDWHRIGLTWDGSNRILYVDDAEVARGTQTGLAPADRGLNIGAAENPGAGNFFSGLLDDIRIYDRPIVP